MSFDGLSVVPHALAESRRTFFTVEKHPILKRRRNWTVKKNVEIKPCAFVVGTTVYMHPTLFAKLKEQK